ncbi:MAG: cupredoxin domain-containing protein [Candidatus Diapherotrites archaeon]|nr:cupredoxin domain-containing protein [Candidatus Diapherotrites archaeon]
MKNDVKSQRMVLLLFGGFLVAFLVLLAWWGTTLAQPSGPAGVKNPVSGAVQDVYIKALSTGVYDNREVVVKKGIPVRLHFSAESGAGCGRVLIMKKFNVSLLSRNGEEQVAEFTPQETGAFEYSCSMRMFVGQMVVVP